MTSQAIFIDLASIPGLNNTWRVYNTTQFLFSNRNVNCLNIWIFSNFEWILINFSLTCVCPHYQPNNRERKIFPFSIVICFKKTLNRVYHENEFFWLHYYPIFYPKTLKPTVDKVNIWSNKKLFDNLIYTLLLLRSEYEELCNKIHMKGTLVLQRITRITQKKCTKILTRDD